MLHAARAQGVQIAVDGIIFLAETDEVAHHFGLRQPWQSDKGGTLQPAKAIVGYIGFAQVDARAILAIQLEQQRFFQFQALVAG